MEKTTFEKVMGGCGDLLITLLGVGFGFMVAYLITILSVIL